MCSKVLNGHIILTDTSITTILAPEMTYTPVLIGYVMIEMTNTCRIVINYYDTANVALMRKEQVQDI